MLVTQQPIPLVPGLFVSLVAGRCGNCKNWQEVGRFGVCGVVNSQNAVMGLCKDSEPLPVAFVGDGSLLTTADFGCVLFVAKASEG